MRNWHQTGQSGCLFARLLAREVEAGQWRSLVLMAEDEDLPQLIADAVPGALRTAMDAEACAILSLLFPTVTTPLQLGSVSAGLARGTPIAVTEDHSHSGWVTTAMRLDISGAGELAWIMAFGPFSEWPPTRRGPVTELTIRMKPKPPDLFHRLNQDPTAAHLADTSLPLTEDQMEAVFERTEKATRDVLGESPDFRSAARTTFSFTANMRESG